MLKMGLGAGDRVGQGMERTLERRKDVHLQMILEAVDALRGGGQRVAVAMRKDGRTFQDLPQPSSPQR